MYTITGVQAANNGEYSVKIKNDCTPLGVEKIAGSLKALDLATTPVGSGIMSGENCFDLVLSNFNDDCGLEADRAALQADFTTAKVYTFTNSGTANKNLRFMVEGADGLLTSITPDPTIPAPTVVLTNGGKYTVSLQFDKALVEAAGLGTNDDTAIKLKVIALYDVGAVTNQASVDVTVKDCQCCGTQTNPARVKIGKNKYLTAQIESLCWMMENSREGTPTRTSGAGNASGANGYYYAPANAKTACPAAWRLPTETEYRQLHLKAGEWGPMMSAMVSNVVDPNVGPGYPPGGAREGLFTTISTQKVYYVNEWVPAYRMVLSSSGQTINSVFRQDALKALWIPVKCVK